MNDLTHTIVFKKHNKVIWSLRCDSYTFERIEFWVNRVILDDIK